MVDLVEGSAVASLGHMRGVVESRPTAFRSPGAAVHWALRCGAMRNPLSARFSLPDQLVLSVLTEEETAQATSAQQQQQQQQQHECTDGNELTAITAAASSIVATSSTVASSSSPSSAAAAPIPCYRWRTDLLASESYWGGWFHGLGSLFLGCSAPKLLLLASADRLDPLMMVAQMQGKLQVDVVANAGHSVQEDQPAETARRIAAFAARHKFNQMAVMWAKTNAATTAAAPGAMATSSASHPRTAALSVPNVLLSAPPSSAASSSPSTSSAASTSHHSKPPVPLFHE